MKKAHILKHITFEGIALMEEWFRNHHFNLSYTNFYDGDKLPPIEDFDWLIIMGGPMSVNDEKTLTWLSDEQLFIKKTIQANKVVLGFCLGAQLLSKVLGGNVYPGKQKEIGWLTIENTPQAHHLIDHFPVSQTVFQWHGETFDIPLGAIPFSKSKAFPHQSFLFNDRIVAMQFHLEMDASTIKNLVQAFENELVSDTYIQSKEEILNNQSYFENNKALLFKLMDKLNNL